MGENTEFRVSAVLCTQRPVEKHLKFARHKKTPGQCDQESKEKNNRNRLWNDPDVGISWRVFKKEAIKIYKDLFIVMSRWEKEDKNKNQTEILELKSEISEMKNL